ncbi:hypothetical protein DQ04_00271170 [Trypanosoma grayi]|uniref:hypothetical protein n=1 Tax=Trypanosoma grayi TaxID=71804 RepID=UPI0004F43843|nr:hypothetical protein DQ04_00271170 [Trypanosoma grayi]KEG14883.1 hypothetical protein DQ04_00271170 [Trypanosoma grayi]
MVVVFYRSVSDGWRVGVAESLDGVEVRVRDGMAEETVPSSDIYIPEFSPAEGDVQLLFRMDDAPSEFLQKKNAALMSPSPLVGLPPLIELLRYRVANDELSTNIGDNFSILLGEGSLLDIHPPGYDMALKAVLAWRGSQQQQVVVSCGHAQSNLFDDLVCSCCLLLDASPVQLRVIDAGMKVISAFTTTIGKRQMSYLQAHVCAEEVKHESVKGVRVDCDHLCTSRIGEPNDLNFKVFSYILYGFSDEEKERLYINRKQEDFVCQSNIRDVNLIAQLRSEYATFTEALEVLGISFTTQLALFGRIAAIMHLTEIEFYDDGSLSNLPALKNVARLLQMDFQESLRIFTSRDVCVAAAQLLYQATVAFVIRKVNSVMNFADSSSLPPPSVTVLFIPPLSPVASDDLQNIVVACVYEDLVQSFLRVSDQEVVRWQRSGIRVPENMQAVLDSLDNYSLLKVLYGLGGILSVAQTTQPVEQIKVALTSCAKHAKVKFNASTLVLIVEHSFGTRQYQFPRSAEQLVRLKTVHHADYEALRAFLIENADVDTQEALHLLLQSDKETAEHVITQEMQHVRSLLDVLKDETKVFWWIGSVDLGADYRGDYVEAQIREIPLRCAVQLRRHLPEHYITCRPNFISTAFKPLLPRATSSRSDVREVAEAILSHCGAQYYVAPEYFLLSGETLGELYLRLKKQLQRHAMCIQAFARVQLCAYTLRWRVAAWADVIQNIERQRHRIVEERRYRSHNNSMHNMQFLDLVESENTARTTIKEECWSERAEMQREFQADIESTLVQLVASSIRREDKDARAVMRCNQTEKLHMIEEYIQQRLERHRANLDSIIEEQLCGATTQRQSQRALKAHEHLLRERARSEGRRRRLEEAIERKRSKSEMSRREREREAQARGNKMWLRHHRNQVARKEIQQARESYNETLAVQMLVNDMETKMTQRVKEEVVSFRRQENERLFRRLREERQRREEAVIQAAKASEGRVVQRELRQERAREAGDRRKKREAQKQFDEQERQRRAMQRIHAATERQKKKLMGSLLMAQSSLTKPRLYEHSTGQASLRTRMPDCPLDEPLMLASGKKTYARMLSESSLRGLFDYHTTKPRAKSPYPYATPNR